jgi:hypothetical protein
MAVEEARLRRYGPPPTAPLLSRHKLEVGDPSMKTVRPIFALSLVLFLLAACGPRNEWTTYTVNETQLTPYSFEYPADWMMEAGNDYFNLASDAKLSEGVHEKLKPGQILVSLTMNINMPPERMLDVSASMLQGAVEFKETVSIESNGRPAAYKDGTETKSGDQIFMIAVDMGKNMRGLLYAKMAKGELDRWRETLMKMAKSLRVNS